MKKVFFMLALVLVSMAAKAQTTRIIKGAVVDADGNPLPGATVEATNGAESTTVDADGSFSLEVPRWLNTATARYAGMRNKKLKVQDGDMVFRMKPNTDIGWFLNLVGGVVLLDRSDDDFDLAPSTTYSVGLMGGFLGNWGGYAKLLWTPSSVALEPAVPTVSVGVTKRVFPFMHGYLGAGYSKVNSPYSNNSDWYEAENTDGFVFDLGAIFLVKNHFSTNVGVSCVTDFDYLNLYFQVGVGYVF